MKEINSIPNHSNECILSDMLIKYIKGELSGLEKNRVERHISSCEMCSDELEGLSIMENPERVDEISKELNQRIDKLTVIPEREIPYLGMYLKIAASIVFIIGVSTIIYFTAFQKTQDSLPNYALMEAMEIPSPSPLQDSSNDVMLRSIVSQDKMENRGLETNQGSKKEEGVEKGIAKSDVTIKYIAPVVVDSIAANDEIAEAKEEAVVESIAIDKLKVAEVRHIASENVVKPIPSSAEKKSTMAAGGVVRKELKVLTDKTDEEVASMPYSKRKEIAIQLYNKGQYERALIVLEGIRYDFLANDSIIFYTSLCYHQLKRFDQSITGMVAITKNQHSLLYNQARWYYALSLIGAEKKEEAIVILEQIVKDNSTYKREAQKEIEKLKGNQ